MEISIRLIWADILISVEIQHCSSEFWGESCWRETKIKIKKEIFEFLYQVYGARDICLSS